MTTDDYKCPKCHLHYIDAPTLDEHLATSPECRAYASIARSLAAVGAILCPRCMLAVCMSGVAVWTGDAFVHQACATEEEREAAGCQTLAEIHKQATEIES